jgi:hypothetical protein
MYPVVRFEMGIFPNIERYCILKIYNQSNIINPYTSMEDVLAFCCFRQAAVILINFWIF